MRLFQFFFLICLIVFFCESIFAAENVLSAVNVVKPYLVRIETIGGYDSVNGRITNEGTSTGILLDKDGYVLTSTFNFLHEPSSILLLFADGTKKSCRKIADDRLRMLTLLKANDFSGAVLQNLPHRSKSSIRIGESCIAVGTVFSAEPNIAQGIISGKDRIWGKALQTDAALGPNNYGGVLIDQQGSVLGIPVPLDMMSQDTAAGAEMYDAGVGLAVPWEDVLTLVPMLKLGKNLLPGTLGISFKENRIFIGGPIIDAVLPESPAALSGLQTGDEIVQINGVQIKSALDVTKNLRQRYADEKLILIFRRAGTEHTVTLHTVQ